MMTIDSLARPLAALAIAVTTVTFPTTHAAAQLGQTLLEG